LLTPNLTGTCWVTQWYHSTDDKSVEECWLDPLMHLMESARPLPDAHRVHHTLGFGSFIACLRIGHEQGGKCMTAGGRWVGVGVLWQRARVVTPGHTRCCRAWPDREALYTATSRVCEKRMSDCFRRHCSQRGLTLDPCLGVRHSFPHDTGKSQ